MKKIHLQARGDTVCVRKDHWEFMYLDHNISVSDFDERFKRHLQNINFIRIASYTVLLVIVINCDRKLQ